MASAELEALLEVQDRDTAVDRLRHRRETLPERADLAAIEERRNAVAGELDRVREQRDELLKRQTDAEGELAALEARIAEINAKMYSGTVSASRELQAMSGEVDSLKKRQSSLEDRALEAMTEREPVDAELARLEGEDAVLADQALDIEMKIAEAEESIDGEVAGEVAGREEVASRVPPALLQQYERIKDRLGGIGAARLAGASCTGCHLTLPATEIDRLKKAPADAVILCDQCGRILVR